MDLGMELYLYPETIKSVFGYIAIIVAFVVIGKVAIHSIKNNKKITKVEEEKNEK